MRKEPGTVGCIKDGNVKGKVERVGKVGRYVGR